MREEAFAARFVLGNKNTPVPETASCPALKRYEFTSIALSNKTNGEGSLKYDYSLNVVVK
jgi:hypothetical protein